MTEFFKKKSKLDVYEKAIIDVYSKSKKMITPSEVAKYLRISPHTAKDRIVNLVKTGVLTCKNEGNKKYCSMRKK
jgi:predicted ArsR family transcriptional regulator